MKKIYLLVVALLAMFVSQAQNISLRVYISSSPTIKSNNVINFLASGADTTYSTVVITNIGTTTIPVTDTFAYFHLASGTGWKIWLTSPLPVNDSVVKVEKDEWATTGSSGGSFSWCDSVWTYVGAYPGTVVTDPTTSNNKYCNTVNIVKVGIESVLSEHSSGLNIYPNPASGVINFNYEFTQSSQAGVTITDMLGRQVYSQDYGTVSGKKEFSIDVNKLSSGLYLLEMNVDGNKVVSKFSVQK